VSLKDGAGWHLAGWVARAQTEGRPRSAASAEAQSIGDASPAVAHSRIVDTLAAWRSERQALALCSTCAHPGIRGRSCDGRASAPGGRGCRRPTTILPPGAPASARQPTGALS
jgi:hypothetical protein